MKIYEAPEIEITHFKINSSVMTSFFEENQTNNDGDIIESIFIESIADPDDIEIGW